MLLGLVLFAPAQADAGCSHPGLTSIKMPGVDSLSGLALLDAADGRAKTDPPPRDRPCSGPTCSKNSSVPYVPAPVTSLRSEPWCETSMVLRPVTPDLVDELSEPALLHSVPVGSALERPPRSHS